MSPGSEQPHQPPAPASLPAAFDEFVAAIAESARHIVQHPFFGDVENRAGAVGFLAGMILARLEEDVVFDGDHPYFRVLDTRIREGGDNPDQRYLISRINGGDTYRIWGRRGSCRRLDLQIYAGAPYVAGSGGRAASFLDFEQIDLDRDGGFEIVASPSRQGGNWLENPDDATRILVRQVYSEWTPEPPGEVHIDRVGHEGEPRAVPGPEAMANRLRSAADSLATHTRVWPAMVQDTYLAHLEPNQLSVPFDPGALGGVPGRFMCHGTWDLAEHEALVVTTWPVGAHYQGIQLADLWFSSLEYANRQTSLTADQAHLDHDGAFRFVVSATDPGVANWLDTTGRRRGVMLLRFDGMGATPFEPARWPDAVKVGLADLGAHLPADTRRVTPEQRRAALAARRRHIQVRFGN